MSRGPNIAANEQQVTGWRHACDEIQLKKNNKAIFFFISLSLARLTLLELWNTNNRNTNTTGVSLDTAQQNCHLTPPFFLANDGDSGKIRRYENINISLRIHERDHFEHCVRAAQVGFSFLLAKKKTDVICIAGRPGNTGVYFETENSAVIDRPAFVVAAATLVAKVS